MKNQYVTIIIIILALFLNSRITYAQNSGYIDRDPINANCGNIIEGEFTTNFERQPYIVNLKAGDELDVSAVPVGDSLKTSLFVAGPTLLVLALSDSGGQIMSSGEYSRLRVEQFPKVKSGVVSARGAYSIFISDFTWNNFLGDSGGLGEYTIYIGCTLRDGTVIKPGDNVPTPTPNISQPPPGNTITIPDFSNIAPFLLTSGTAMSGGISPNPGELLAYSLPANAGDKVDLTFNKSGNLNLGLVVLSPDNKVVFQASLVTSESLTTRFTLPTAGTYTIGVFRVDLLPPDSPQPTAFQVQATLNP